MPAARGCAERGRCGLAVRILQTASATRSKGGELAMWPQNAADLIAQLNALLPLAITNGLRVLGAIAILLIGLWLAGKVHGSVLRLLGRTPHIDEMLKSFFGSAARYLVLTVTVLAVLFGVG